MPNRRRPCIRPSLITGTLRAWVAIVSMSPRILSSSARGTSYSVGESARMLAPMPWRAGVPGDYPVAFDIDDTRAFDFVADSVGMRLPPDIERGNHPSTSDPAQCPDELDGEAASSRTRVIRRLRQRLLSWTGPKADQVGQARGVQGCRIEPLNRSRGPGFLPAYR